MDQAPHPALFVLDTVKLGAGQPLAKIGSL